MWPITFLDMGFLTLDRTLGILGTKMPVTSPSEFIVKSLGSIPLHVCMWFMCWSDCL